jgi:hypothetical protein
VYGGKPLNGHQKRANTLRYKVRGKGEPVFLWRKNRGERFQICRIDLVGAGFAIGMNHLIDHMGRLALLFF